MNVSFRIVLGGVAACILGQPARAQQVPDRNYQPTIATPAYAMSRGPVVCLDEGHHNFHTLDNRFWVFGELLRRDGYVVRPLRAPFDGTSLGACRIVVISNAQPGDEEWDKYPYPTPSAFTADEVRAIHRWVEQGGSLLLIADHMPLAGAAASLAEAFGVIFTDGFAVSGFDTDSAFQAAFDRPTIFSSDAGTLRPHPIVQGRNGGESVTSVRTFTGQAFRAPREAAALLVLPPSFLSLMPKKAWQFEPGTKRLAVGGWLQGAAMQVGAGRAAFFGEAAMFSAQVAGPQKRPMGMNAPGAERNFQFVLNVMHWLSRVL